MNYKLTDKDGKTQPGAENETQWGENVTHRAKDKGKKLCTGQVIHGYDDYYLAVYMNPAQGNYDEGTMLMWAGKGRRVVTDGIKSGYKQFTTLRRIPIPELTTEQRVTITIHLALQLYVNDSFRKWAIDWLDGIDRSSDAAAKAADAAYAAYATAKAACAADKMLILETIYDVLENWA